MFVPLLALSLAAAPCTAGVCFTARDDARGAQLTAVNRSVAPAALHVALVLQNASSSAGSDFELELSAGATMDVARLTSLGGKWSYHYDYRYTLGVAHARHQPARGYALPFAPGRAVRVLQAANGSYTHQGDMAFAYDFDLPEGSVIRAAREGVVVDVRDTETGHGETAAFDDKANYVRVLHGDGTMGSYLHLQPQGARVAVGAHVARGQLLGLSGNTGHSKGPHLHFEVSYRIDARRRQTVPAHFDALEGSGLTLEEGRSYTARE